MKRMFCMIAAVALVAGIIPLAAADDKDDSKSFQGNWKLLEISSSGKKMDRPREIDAWSTWTFAGDNLTMKFFGEEKETVVTIKLDSSKKPKHINLTSGETGKDKETVEAIYQIDGDTLKIAQPKAGPKGKRPVEFDEKDIVVLTFKKEKKK